MFFHKKEPKVSATVKFLMDADAAYVRAFQVQNLAGFFQFATRELCLELVPSVNSKTKVYSGLDRYKHVNWVALASDDTIYQKIVYYDHIKLNKGVVAPVGDDYKEDWTLVKTSDGLRVSSIRRLTND